MADYKVTTREVGDGYFHAYVNGHPLVGDRGGYSRLASRKEARDEAHRRMQAECNQHIKERRDE